MTNLAGHDMDAVRDAFHAAQETDAPACFIAYTIKGYGLPFQGHKDNHAGLMTPAQMDTLTEAMGIAEGDEWEPLAGLDVPAGDLRAFLDAVPFNQPGERRHHAPKVPVPAVLAAPPGECQSTQQGLVASWRTSRGATGSWPTDRDHVARRHRVDESRGVGQPARGLLQLGAG